MMYFFAIVDDDKTDIERIRDVLAREAKCNGFDVRFDTYTDSRTFDYSVMYDAVFLDIEMSHENGLSFARRLNNCYETKIVMVTNYYEYINQVFDVRAFHFINKANLKIEAIKVCKLLFMALNKDNATIDGYIFERKKKVRLKNIYYIDVFNHTCLAHTFNHDDIRIKDTLTNISEKLDCKVFVQVNRSTIINLAYIKTIANGAVTLKNEITLTITLKYQKDFDKAYENYLWDTI